MWTIVNISPNSLLFDYACSAWYSDLQKTMKHKHQILQNKTIRFAFDLSPWTHRDITLKTQWLPVDVRVEQLTSSITINILTSCTGLSMAELHVILLRV